MSEGKTRENLKTAFVGEAKACLRLLGYAERAEQDGYPQMAKLFRAISRAESVHALRHLRLMGVIGTTEENLKASFERETGVSENIYPEFIRQAEADGNQAAVLSFSQSRDAEQFHARLYKNAIDHMVAETETSYFVCTVCGYVADGSAPEQCPVCGAPSEKFEKVD
ncbi:MAG: rubrerythrin family protein [Deltaproteobacteria bacterium]|nr:MAG: rubrerythrin family protein [Deltaproteobacteria bacterium]